MSEDKATVEKVASILRDKLRVSATPAGDFIDGMDTAAAEIIAALPPTDIGLVEALESAAKRLEPIATDNQTNYWMVALAEEVVGEITQALSTHGKQWSDSAPTERQIEAGVNARNKETYGDTRQMVAKIYTAMRKATTPPKGG